jgi:hypothetical protein
MVSFYGTPKDDEQTHSGLTGATPIVDRGILAIGSVASGPVDTSAGIEAGVVPWISDIASEMLS